MVDPNLAATVDLTSSPEPFESHIVREMHVFYGFSDSTKTLLLT